MLALIAALKEEIADIRKEMTAEEVIVEPFCHLYQGKYRKRDVLLAVTGMGRERAEIATRFILERYPVSTLISLGFGGALDEELEVGEVIVCSTLYCGNGLMPAGTNSALHSDAHLVSLMAKATDDSGLRSCCGSSVTVAQPVSNPEVKEKLGKALRAHIVDMESYWIARIAAERKIPFTAIRAVSDTRHDSLPAFDQMLTTDGKLLWGKAMLYFISHPAAPAKFFNLYRNARRARQSLTAFIDCIVTEVA